MSTHEAALAEYRQSQLDFFGIDPEMIARVRSMKSRVLSWAKEAMTTAFEHVEGEPEVVEYFALRDNMAALQKSMLASTERLLSAKFDSEYYDAMDEIGARHAKLPYPSFVYTSGYASLLSTLQRVAASKRNRMSPDDLDALIRVSIFDLENMMAAFYRARMAHDAALDADAAKVRAMLAGDTFKSG